MTGRWEDVWVTTLQDNSCWSSFSLSDSHLHPLCFPEGYPDLDIHSFFTRGWRASACPVATSQRILTGLSPALGVKYGGGEGTTGLVTEAGEVCCHVCSLDPHLGPQAHLDSSVLQRVLKSETRMHAEPWWPGPYLGPRTHRQTRPLSEPPRWRSLLGPIGPAEKPELRLFCLGKPVSASAVIVVKMFFK